MSSMTRTRKETESAGAVGATDEEEESDLDCVHKIHNVFDNGEGKQIVEISALEWEKSDGI